MKDKLYIPITIFTGFLGTGKTTIIKKLVEQFPKKNFLLLVNEFGESNIESQFYGQLNNLIIQEYSYKCLCCIEDIDLSSEIIQNLQKHQKIDEIIIEASGTSNLIPIVEQINQLSKKISVFLKSIVCIIDSKSFLNRLNQYKTIEYQLKIADLIILNKIDNIDIQTINTIKSTIKQLNPEGEIITTGDASFIYNIHQYTRDESAIDMIQKYKKINLHPDKFEFFIYKNKNQMDYFKIINLFNNLPNEIVRVKAIFSFGNFSKSKNKKYLLQISNGVVTENISDWTKEEIRENVILFVGEKIDKEYIKNHLDLSNYVAPKTILGKILKSINNFLNQ